MADDEDIAALVVDNGSGMCKGMCDRRRRRLFGYSATRAFVSGDDRQRFRYQRLFWFGLKSEEQHDACIPSYSSLKNEDAVG